MSYEKLSILLFPGMVLPPATGHAGALHQHLPGHHVLQAADVAPTPRAQRPRAGPPPPTATPGRP